MKTRKLGQIAVCGRRGYAETEQHNTLRKQFDAMVERSKEG